MQVISVSMTRQFYWLEGATLARPRSAFQTGGHGDVRVEGRGAAPIRLMAGVHFAVMNRNRQAECKPIDLSAFPYSVCNFPTAKQAQRAETAMIRERGEASQLLLLARMFLTDSGQPWCHHR